MRRIDHGWGVVVVLFLMTGLVGWVVISSVGFSDVWRARADATADWLVASALVDGRDPHGNLYELAQTYDVSFWDSDDVTSRVQEHPRTPGALVLLAPLTLVESEDALAAMLIAGLILTSLAFALLSRSGQIAVLALFVGLAYVLVAGPARWSYLFGTQSHILFALFAISSLLLMRGDSAGAGVLLGITATLKVFPILILIALVWHRRFRASIGMLLTVAGLNFVPLLLPNVSISGSMGTLTSSVEGWLDLVANISIAGVADRLFAPPSWLLWVIHLGLLTIAGFVVVRWRKPLVVDMAILVGFAILASPLAWPHYLLIVAAPMLVALEGLHVFGKLALVVAGLMTIPIGSVLLYTTALIVAISALIIWTNDGHQRSFSMPRLLARRLNEK